MEEGGWFKVDFETVPELVESRRVFLKAGKAYVPSREQMSMVLAGFTERLDKGLEVCLPPKPPILRSCNHPLNMDLRLILVPAHRPRPPPPR